MNSASTGEKEQCQKRRGNGGERWFGKLQETAEVWSCMLCSGTELQREGRYFTQTQTAVMGIFMYLVFVL